MKFKTAKDVDLWCNIGNFLPVHVGRACSPYERRCQKSKDPRLQALASVIYEMTQQFRSELKKRMDYIEKNSDEFETTP